MQLLHVLLQSIVIYQLGRYIAITYLLNKETRVIEFILWYQGPIWWGGQGGHGPPKILGFTK